MARYTDGMAAMHARVDAVRRLVMVDGAAAAMGQPLTSREIDILRLLQGSLSLQEIAGELYLSFNTVKTHSRAVYRKLGVHTRSEAVLAGRQQGLV
jgi:LuxR family maltose regulon positive regulatory protein